FMAHQFGLDAQADARWIALTQMIERGAGWLDQVLQRWPSPESILGDTELSSSGHSEPNGRPADWASLQGMIDSASPNQLLRCLPKSSSLYLVTIRDPFYPPLLAECGDRPPFLFVQGDLDSLRSSTLSVVGTRKPSLDGQRAATDLTHAAVALGLTVVSGLALGIDGVAHQAALSAKGNTIAVLPSGLDQIYPSRHRRLAANIAESGAVVSEFPLGTPPRKHHFHRRNRTLSGFSQATLVIEAGRPSGTLITASAAADQGRDVMTLPWSIYHPEGAGCRYLLDAGAMLIQSPEDLAHCLDLRAPDQPMTQTMASHASAVPAQFQTLPLDQRQILSLLGRESHRAETLALRLDWDMDRCLACLSALEVQGWINKGPKGYSAMR
ncbi:MAG: DNA-protecting protein DprA, partial [Halieaceae bacterium]|nr:DNA-protecting protein DprA [Halieaceae bacterium]